MGRGLAHWVAVCFLFVAGWVAEEWLQRGCPEEGTAIYTAPSIIGMTVLVCSITRYVKVCSNRTVLILTSHIGWLFSGHPFTMVVFSTLSLSLHRKESEFLFLFSIYVFKWSCKSVFGTTIITPGIFRLRSQLC